MPEVRAHRHALCAWQAERVWDRTGRSHTLRTVRVYLDHAATTPPRPEALAAMADVLARQLGNPSSVHASGQAARRALDDARDVLAEVLGAKSSEIVFTSGGTESDNLAITGVLARRPGRALCSTIEHEAVLEPVHAADGCTVPVTKLGVVDLDALAAKLDDTVSIVSVMTANNENGVIQPIAEIAALVHERAPGAVFHTDAVQAAGWLDLSVVAAQADLIAISGHKFGAPIGSGALVVREGTKLAPLLLGGGQEHERRSGTPNVAGAMAVAVAARLAAESRDEFVARVSRMRDRLADGLCATIDGMIEPALPANCDRSGLAPGIVQVCIAGVEGEALLFLLDEAGVDASAGSACAAGALDPSHVLAAMGVPGEMARGALRLSLGHTTTEADVDRALDVIPAAVAQLRRAA